MASRLLRNPRYTYIAITMDRLSRLKIYQVKRLVMQLILAELIAIVIVKSSAISEKRVLLFQVDRRPTATVKCRAFSVACRPMQWSKEASTILPGTIIILNHPHKA